jgi:hypothetical protein
LAAQVPAELKPALSATPWAEGIFTEDLVDGMRAWPDVAPEVGAARLARHRRPASAFVPAFFQAAGDAITSVCLREATLEDAYFEIVGAALDSPETAL